MSFILMFTPFSLSPTTIGPMPMDHTTSQARLAIGKTKPSSMMNGELKTGS